MSFPDGKKILRFFRSLFLFVFCSYSRFFLLSLSELESKDYKKFTNMNNWFIQLLTDPNSIAHIVLLYSVVICVGVRLGKVKIGGVALGVTFVLFAGIVAGHLFKALVPGVDMTHPYAAPFATIDFIKEFGLILFVYCIGLQVGPGFFASFRKGGIEMNLLAIFMVILDVIVMLILYFLFLDTSDPTSLPMMVGVLNGAVTNTPGLGAASSTLYSFFAPDKVPSIASGYACAYPLGVVGIIGATIAIRYICKISPEKEEEALQREHEEDPHAKPCHLVLRVKNQAFVGKTLPEVSQFLNRNFVCTRCVKNGEMFIPKPDTKLEQDMDLYIVCAEAEAEAITVMMGEALDIDWKAAIASSKFVSRRVVVTKSDVVGKSLLEMHFNSAYGVSVTRVTRAGMELFADPKLVLQIGDRLMVTGSEENVNYVANLLGNSVKRLDAPNVGAIFFGILIGILVGMIPISIPGVAVPVKLGLAGGPLVVAILIGAFGYKFKITTYTTTSANLMLREVGLILFLASVGIQAGATFWDTLVQGDGLTYVWTGFLITIIPILIVGIIGRLKFKINYFTLMGVIAGSHTDPPALAFAGQSSNTDAPAVGYSTVYPLAMFLRILTAQIVLLLFCTSTI